MNEISGETERNIYARCMEEIKLRTHAVYSIIRKEYSTLYPMTNLEFMCLQIRKILELIALASMASHKEEYARQHSKFAEKWRAKEILKDLEKLNPNFYPIPTEQVMDEDPTKVKEVRPIEKPYLSKVEFVELYQQCSSMLHADNPFAPPKSVDALKASIPSWMDKIRNLLNHHHVQLYDSEFQLWVVMHAKTDGRVHVQLFQRIGDPPGEGETWETVGRRDYLNYVLNEKPTDSGISFDSDGWASVQELLNFCNKHINPLTREQLDEVVRTSRKHRFSLDESGSRIRVNHQ